MRAKIEELAQRGGVLHDEFKAQTEYLQESDQQEVHRVNQTPSMLLFMPASYEQVNRVLRKYQKHKENFLKLSFTNERQEKSFYFTESQKYLVSLIYNALVSGVTVGTRHFTKLSYSNSQIKQHSIWLVCEDIKKGLVRDDLIKSLGDFSQEKNILKQFARIGQCFSTTQHFKTLGSSDLCEIQDVFNVDPASGARYCMTDGGGLISKKLSQEINKKYGLLHCSAYQIRLGGRKGVLLMDPSLKEDSVFARDSMKKFESPSTDLEIIRCATYSQGHLNRQIIQLMVALGVPKELFLNLQKSIIEKSKFKRLVEHMDSEEQLPRKEVYKGIERSF